LSRVVVDDSFCSRGSKEVLVQALPETTAALAALSLATDDADEALVEEFDRAAATTRRIAPECVGLTLTFVQEGMSFTWVATDLESAALDAIQYLEGGPCVHAVEQGTVTTDSSADPVDERRWQTFAAATARAGVGSTLSIPLMAGDEVYGGLNLYGRTASAFDGHHEELASLYGGWAGGAVTNADLSFTTLARARTAPRVLADAANSNVAVGMIMAAHQVPEETARSTLSDVAARAGVTAGQVADILLETRLL
jgi:GAF domain-containing protein